MQSAIDSGYLFFPAGETIVTAPLKIRPDQVVTIEGHPRAKVSYRGQSNTALFELDPHQGQSPWTGRLQIRNLVAEVARIPAGTNRSILRSTFPLLAMDRLTISNCQFGADGYCIDLQNTDYNVTPSFTNIRTGGGGAIRFKAALRGGNLHYAACMTEIRNWRHMGGNRIGPAFDLLGHDSLILQNVIDEGGIGLRQDLRNNWQGPISLRLASPRGPTNIENYWIEPWGNWVTDAPGCWATEVRTDATTSTGKHNIVQMTNFGIHASYPPVTAFRFLGSNSIPMGHSLVVYINDFWYPHPDYFTVAGKCAVVFNRPYNQGSAILQALAAKYPVRDPIVVSTHQVPTDLSRPGDWVKPDGWYPATDPQVLTG